MIVFRHTLALSMLGWYLMVPPIAKHFQFMPDSKAPLSEWGIFAGYDSADRCEDARTLLIRENTIHYAKDALLAPETPAQGLAARRIAAVCVATNDPRLKEK